MCFELDAQVIFGEYKLFNARSSVLHRNVAVGFLCCTSLLPFHQVVFRYPCHTVDLDLKRVSSR